MQAIFTAAVLAVLLLLAIAVGATVIGALIAAAAFLIPAIPAGIIMLLWNFLIVPLGVVSISFWQALAVSTVFLTIRGFFARKKAKENIQNLVQSLTDAVKKA